MSKVTIADLARSSVIVFGDGYRTRRSEHGWPGYRILRVADVDNGRVHLDGADFVHRDFIDRIGNKTSKAGDVLLTTKGTVGRVAIYPEDSEEVVYSPQLCFFRVTAPGVLSPRYLSYWFKSMEFARQALYRANNTDMAAYINLRDISSLEMSLPGIAEQNSVARILGAMDDKIVANERSLMLFSELEEVEGRRVVQSATESARLDSLATVTKGVSYRSSELDESSEDALVTLKSIDRRGNFSYRGFKGFSGDFKVHQIAAQGDVAVAQTDLTQAADVIGRAVRVPSVKSYGRLIASLDISLVRPREHVPREYLLAALRQPSFREHCLARSSGTTVLHLGRRAVESYELPVASEEEAARYGQEASLRFTVRDALKQEIDILATTRDELLPLLMSGKVRVSDVEKVVEEVL